MEAENSLDQLMKNIADNTVAKMHTCLPAVIVDYDYKKSMASCKPVIKKLYTDGEEVSIPIINNVPVVWMGTKKGMIHFPLNKGDGVLLVFSERPLDDWLSTGKELPPSDSRKFDLADAIAIPGLSSFKNDSIAENNEDFVIKYSDGVVKIKDNGTIDINDGNLTVEAS